MRRDMRFHMNNPVRPGELAIVVGAGVSGAAAGKLLCALGARVRLLEKNPDRIMPAHLQLAQECGIEMIAGPHAAEHFQGASLVVPSPGVPLQSLLPLLASAGYPRMMAEMELASLFVEEPVLAVTGTSGKTTTTSLCAAMLQESGKKVFLGGNIGPPLSEYVLSGGHCDVAVLEASSFQLMGCSSFHPHVAVLLNISPNHLDQHADMEEYVAAKFRIFACQTAEDAAVIQAELVPEARARNVAARIVSFAESGRFMETPLAGKHNQANIEAAYMACRELGVSLETAQKAAAAFMPLPNRLELVGEWNAIAYVNDSKCTTVSALHAALESMERPVHLLAGGLFKGGNLATLIPLLGQKVRSVALFGGSREEFCRAWRDTVPTPWFPTLEEAVRHVRGLARRGDAILLAPATSSYDQYDDYEERGEDFRRMARMLQ